MNKITPELKDNLKDLITEEFAVFMEKAFKNCPSNRISVQNVTRAYYVFIDLKGGIKLSMIEANRLDKFHSILWGWVLKNPSDLISKKLFEAGDQQLSIL